MVLDLQVLNLVYIVLSVIFAIVMVMVQLSFKHQYKGIIDWGLAFILNSITQIIYIMSESISFENLMFLTGLFFLISLLEFKRGWKKYYDVQNSVKLDSLLILCFILLYTFFKVNIDTWILFTHFSSSLILLYTFSFILYKARMKHRYSSPVVMVFLFITLVFILSGLIYLLSIFEIIRDRNYLESILFWSYFTIVRDILLFFAIVSAIINKMRYDLEELVLEKEGLLDKMDSLYITDPLTGLLNRRGFNRNLEWEIEKYKREGRSSIITLCDIDHFKVVNDTYGYECGDLIIKHMASILKESLRSEDCVARWGGGEFIILQSNNSIEESITSLERIRDEICSSSIQYNGATVSVTMSFGISTFDKDMDDYEIIITRAGNNLHRAKERGRNKILYLEES